MSFGYWLFALMIIPVIAGIILFYKFHAIKLKEMIASIGVAIAIIVLCLGISKCGEQQDTETLSGKIKKVIYVPEWKAEWTETETYTTTDSKGNTQYHTRNVTKRETHRPKWTGYTSFGTFATDEVFFRYVGDKYGIHPEKGSRPDYDSGDKNDYVAYVNDDDEFVDYPVTETVHWSNPIKSSKSLYSFNPPSKEEARALGIFDYPKNSTFSSSRLVNTNAINIWNWDKMNSALGPDKHVNLILVRFAGSMDLAKKQQSYWHNGKKNDLVICYNGDDNKPANWCYVFGWSKTELVKTNLQSLFLEKPVNDLIIEDIKKIVRKDFLPHDWLYYKEETFVIPTAYVITAFILMAISQVLLYIFFHKEDPFNY